MKLLILITLLFSRICFAENWLNKTKILNASKEAHSLKSECERVSNETCFDLGNYPSSIFSEIDLFEDDLSRPVYSKKEIDICLSESECDSIHSHKVCASDETAIKNYDLLQVYCTKVISYEQKTIKSIAIDQAKLSAYQTQKAIEEIAKQKENGIQFALKRIECGKRVIGLLVLRNSAKTLTTANVAQINQTYAPIKGLIDTGSLSTAKEQMELIIPDGMLITSEDKTDLLAEINKCL